MGGVGLVFYRDGQSPYLVVKDVVHDGPAFRSSLIYHGDKLCCINDFDLAWSEKTPRSQQPQLPGSHGSAVTLTFDRSVDTSYPERFTITLIRNMGFYPGLCLDALQNVLQQCTCCLVACPRAVFADLTQDMDVCTDRLSSTPFKPILLLNSNSSNPPPDKNHISSSPSAQRAEKCHAIRSAAPPIANSAFSSGWPQLEPTPKLRRNSNNTTPGQENKLNVDFDGKPHSPPSPGQLRAGVVAEPWAGAGNRNSVFTGGSDKEYDSFPASQSSDLDDLIQEIARTDQILELQSRLSTGEIEHEQQIKEFQRNKAALEGMVKTLRSDVDSARKKANDLEKRLDWQGSPGQNSALAKSYEARMLDLQAHIGSERQRFESEKNEVRQNRDKVITERDAALTKMSAFEKDVQARLQELQAQLEHERVRRQELEQQIVDTKILQQVQTEKELLERQNEDLTRQLIELKMLLRAESRVNLELTPSPQQAHCEARKSNTTRAAAPALRPPPQDATPLHDFQIPGLQMQGEIESEPARQSEDIEMHQRPSSAHLKNMRPNTNLVRIPRTRPSSPVPPQKKTELTQPYGSPQPQLISQQPQARYQVPIPAMPRAQAHEQSPHRTTPVIPKLNLPKAAPSTPKNTTGIRAGIGMSFHPDAVSGRFIITDVHPNGPAGQAVAQESLVIGDALLAVNGSSVQGMTVPQIVEDILGPEGTAVLLTIARSFQGKISNQTVTLSLIRARPGERPVQNDSNNAYSPSDTGSTRARSKSSSPHPVPAAPKLEQDKIVLPTGWVVEMDPSSGRTYYVNHTLKTFSWARPVQPNGTQSETSTLMN